MIVNFHYEQHYHYPSEYSHIVIFDGLFDRFVQKYPDINFQKMDYRRIDPIGNPLDVPFSKFKHNHGCFNFLLIENEENKKYFIVSHWDKLIQITGGEDGKPGDWGYWDLENCVEIFPAVGTQTNDRTYSQCNINYTPYSYVPYKLSFLERTETLFNLKIPKIIPDKPHIRFGGDCGYLFRRYLCLKNDKRYHIHNEQMSPTDFYDEMATFAVIIDINSVAEISGRTSDAFGLGSALVRPKLGIRYHNPLIPDYHYAEVKCNDLSDYPALADAYIERFEEVKKDKDFIHFLSINGRKWYEENCTIDSHVNLLDKLIDLNKLL
jgi:hypothetical protein